MSEMPHAGENHGEARVVGCVNRFLIAHRPARRHDRRDARACRQCDAVFKRKEGVRGHYRPLRLCARAGHGNAHAVYAVGLTAEPAGVIGSAPSGEDGCNPDDQEQV